jgi:hypothetical protein
MADDFYTQAARARAETIEMQIAASRADLLVHRNQGDLQAAGDAVQQIANLEAERANLTTLYNNYVASQQPAQPEVLTDEERNARPWHKMTPDDGLALARTSKYGKNLDWSDPNVRSGYAEAQRRRHRGE